MVKPERGRSSLLTLMREARQKTGFGPSQMPPTTVYYGRVRVTVG